MSAEKQRSKLLRLHDEEYLQPSYEIAAREAVPGLIREIYELEQQLAETRTALKNEGNLLGTRTEQMEAIRNNRDRYKESFEKLCDHIAEMCVAVGIDPKSEPADAWTLRMRIENVLKTVTRVTAELRHAYMNLTSASNSTEHTKRLADGLIAPQIRALERLVKP